MAGARRIEGALNRTESGADKLRRTVLRYAAVIGTLISVRQIVALSDAYTSLQNRLRIVTASQRQLADVTDQLFSVSQRTATSFTATADLYARVALSSRELGVSQRELVRFTESVNKAILLSGASAQEANAGIIQFSQGIASGALRGDELRSVLEQLPFVADVIAEHLGITRGALRSLGEEGKITTEIILGAFREAADGLDEEFAGIQFTIGNGLQVIANAFTQVIGRFNEMTGASQGLVQLLFGLASLIENSFLPVLIGMIRAGSQAVDVFSSIASAVTAVGSGLGLGSLGDAVSSLAVSFEDLGYAIGQVLIALGTGFLLGRLGALFRLFTAGATATGVLTAAMVRLVAIVRVLGRLTGIIFIFEAINAITSTEPEKLHAVGRAIRSVWDVFGDLPGPNVGEIIDSIGRLLTNLVDVVQGAATSIPGLFRDLGDSIGALIDAAGRLGGSVINSAVRHIRSFYDAAVELGSSAIQRVVAVITRVYRAVANFASSVFQRVPSAVQNVVRHLGDLYDRVASFVGGAIERAADGLEGVRDAVSSLAIGDRIAVIIEWFQELYLAISAFASERLQGVVSFFERIGQGIANAYESVVGTVGDVYNRIVDRYRELSDGTVAIPDIVVTASPTQELERAFRLTQSQTKALADLRDELDPLAVAEREVTEAQALLNDARRAGVIADDEYRELLLRLNQAYREQLEPVRLIHQELAREGELRRVQIDQRETEVALLDRVRDLQEKGVDVTEAETAALRQAIGEQAEHARLLELEQSLYDDLRGPVEGYADQLDALANVIALHPELAGEAARAHRELRLEFLDTQRTAEAGFERGLIRAFDELADQAGRAEEAVSDVFGRLSADPVRDYRLQMEALGRVLEEYPQLAGRAAEVQRDLRIEFLGSQTDFASGFERGLLTVARDFENFAAVAENAVTGWARGAEDALVRFVQTGKLSFRDLIDSIIADLARLVVRRYITQPLFEAISGAFGGAGSGLPQASTITGGLSSLFGGLVTSLGGIFSTSTQQTQGVLQGWTGGLGSLFNGFLGLLGSLFGGIGGAFSSLFNSVLSGLSGVFGGFGSTLASLFNSGLSGIGSSIGGFAGGLGSLFNSLLGGLGSIFSGFGSTLGSLFTSGLQGISNVLGGFAGGLGSLFSSGLSAASSVIGGLVRSGASALGGLVSSAVSSISGVASSIVGSIGGAVSGIASALGPVGLVAGGALAIGSALGLGGSSDNTERARSGINQKVALIPASFAERDDFPELKQLLLGRRNSRSDTFNSRLGNFLSRTGLSTQELQALVQQEGRLIGVPAHVERGGRLQPNDEFDQIVQRLRDGGYVTGPGTGTSDSIAAMLSHGEYVVNAAATARHLPLLEAINDNRQRFQAGGLVQAPRRGGSGGTRVIVNYFGSSEPDIETATTRRADGGEDVTVSIRDVRRGDLDEALEARYGVRPVAA